MPQNIITAVLTVTTIASPVALSTAAGQVTYAGSLSTGRAFMTDADDPDPSGSYSVTGVFQRRHAGTAFSVGVEAGLHEYLVLRQNLPPDVTGWSSKFEDTRRAWRMREGCWSWMSSTQRPTPEPASTLVWGSRSSPAVCRSASRRVPQPCRTQWRSRVSHRRDRRHLPLGKECSAPLQSPRAPARRFNQLQPAIQSGLNPGRAGHHRGMPPGRAPVLPRFKSPENRKVSEPSIRG